MSGVVRKPDFCIWENKDADQLRSNWAADQRLCFRYKDSTLCTVSLNICQWVGGGGGGIRPQFFEIFLFHGNPAAPPLGDALCLHVSCAFSLCIFSICIHKGN